MSKYTKEELLAKQEEGKALTRPEKEALADFLIAEKQEASKSIDEQIAEKQAKLEALKAAEIEASKPRGIASAENDQERHVEYLMQRIPFSAPAIKNQPDLFVGVNGKNFLIQRGKTVMLPRYVVNHLRQSDKQLALALETQQAFVSQSREN